MEERWWRHLFKHDVLKMLRIVYQIQGEYEINKIKGMWLLLVSQKQYKTMPKPNIGHWGSVGDAGDNLLACWEDWLASNGSEPVGHILT
jgi:hypothetical protein